MLALEGKRLSRYTCGELRILSGPLLYNISVLIKFAGRHERIMVKDEPCSFADMDPFEIFFLLNRIQGEIIIRHNPQRIEVGMGRQEIARIDCILSS